MENMFQSAVNFNGDISNWDVSSVTNMKNMFHNTVRFNQDIGGDSWDVSNVEDMGGMFNQVERSLNP